MNRGFERILRNFLGIQSLLNRSLDQLNCLRNQFHQSAPAMDDSLFNLALGQDSMDRRAVYLQITGNLPHGITLQAFRDHSLLHLRRFG